MLPNELGGDEQARLALVCSLVIAGVPPVDIPARLAILEPLIPTPQTRIPHPQTPDAREENGARESGRPT